MSSEPVVADTSRSPSQHAKGFVVRWHAARLCTPAEFDRVFARAERARIDAFLVMATPNLCGHARLGQIVAKRLLKRAVDRNRVKRRVREAFRQVRANLPACDFVVRLIARPEPEPALGSLAEALQRAGRRAEAKLSAAKWPAGLPVPTP